MEIVSFIHTCIPNNWVCLPLGFDKMKLHRHWKLTWKTVYAESFICDDLCCSIWFLSFEYFIETKPNFHWFANEPTTQNEKFNVYYREQSNFVWMCVYVYSWCNTYLTNWIAFMMKKKLNNFCTEKRIGYVRCSNNAALSHCMFEWYLREFFFIFCCFFLTK